jgi:hypothetical protein
MFFLISLSFFGMKTGSIYGCFTGWNCPIFVIYGNEDLKSFQDGIPSEYKTI